jgi:hypothetical protein
MINKSTLIILFFTLNLTFSLKSIEFCGLKLYDQKCFGLYKYKCEKYLCSKNETECNRYKLKNYYTNLLFKFENFDVEYSKKYEKKKWFEKFNKNIKKCEYKFEANNFCVNGKNCVEKKITPTGYGYQYINYKVKCKCPQEKSFECDQYCTTDSTTCDYYKSNKKINKDFAKCGNENSSTVKPFFSIW